MLKAFFIPVKVKNAFSLMVKLNAFGLGPGKVVLARFNRQTRGRYRIFLVPWNSGDKFRHPTQLVPTWRWIHQ